MQTTFVLTIVFAIVNKSNSLEEVFLNFITDVTARSPQCVLLLLGFQHDEIAKLSDSANVKIVLDEHKFGNKTECLSQRSGKCILAFGVLTGVEEDDNNKIVFLEKMLAKITWKYTYLLQNSNKQLGNFLGKNSTIIEETSLVSMSTQGL